MGVTDGGIYFTRRIPPSPPSPPSDYSTFTNIIFLPCSFEQRSINAFSIKNFYRG
jgi:hypothetical protein